LKITQKDFIACAAMAGLILLIVVEGIIL